jgi:hypothetical protein
MLTYNYIQYGKLLETEDHLFEVLRKRLTHL